MLMIRSALKGSSCLAIGFFGLAACAYAQSTDAAVEDATRKLDPISILGDRSPEDPGSFSGINAQEIIDLSLDHPAEILNTLPGVNVQINSGQEHLVALRSPVLTGGAAQGSFLILQNGVPTRSPAFGNANTLLEPHFEVARAIEVVRGPGSAKYGSNAVHGLFNVITVDPSAPDQLELRASASTLERFKADLIADQGPFYAALSLQEDTGWRDDTGTGQQKGTVAYDAKIGEWDSLFWAGFANLNQETAGYIEGNKAYRDRDIAESNPNPEAYRDAQFAMGAARFSRSFGGVDVSVTPYARWQDMTFLQHFLPYKGTEENSHSAFGVMGDVSGGSDAFNWSVGGMLDAASGDLKETQPDPFGFFPGDKRFPVGTHYDYTVDTLASALWGEVETNLTSDIRMLAGLRLEHHDYDYSTHTPAGVFGRFNVPADREDSFDLVTPKLGFIWDNALGNVDLYVNYARGERAPQASDLYRLQNLQTVGEVRKETLDSVEIGARGSALKDRLVFDVAAYVMEKDNFFFRDADGLNVINGKTDHKGVEAMASYDLTDRFQLTGNVSWSDQTYAFSRTANGIVSGNQIDTAPEWLGDLKLDWQATEKLEASLSAEFIGKYFTDEAESAEYNGHTLTNARLGYDVTEAMEVFVIIRNLFDIKYADRADFAFGNDRYFPGEPLNATFGIRSRW